MLRGGDVLTAGRWHGTLAGLCALRLAVPLAALAASGTALPGLPRYVYEPTPGDAHGFYAAARELLASWGRLGAPVLVTLVLALVAASALLLRLWRGRPPLRGWLVAAGAAAISLTVTIAITQTSSATGAAVVGWSLVWSLPMLPYRTVGLPLDPDVAFGFGLALSLAANVVTVVATWLIGLRVSGRRSVALLAAGLFAAWPLLSGLVGGERGWTNGTWQIDAGLHMYTEPVSTALVAVALVLLLGRFSPVRLASAGVVLSIATAVRLSNGLLAALVLVFLVRRIGARRALPYLAGAASYLPVVAAWWPRGYAALFGRPDVWPPHPFSLDYVVRSWTDSIFFSPRALLILVPLALVGVLALSSRWALALLGSVILSNAVFYSFYANTAQHPRFLHVALPSLLVLWAAGATMLVERLWRASGKETVPGGAG